MGRASGRARRTWPTSCRSTPGTAARRPAGPPDLRAARGRRPCQLAGPPTRRRNSQKKVSPGVQRSDGVRPFYLRRRERPVEGRGSGRVPGVRGVADGGVAKPGIRHVRGLARCGGRGGQRPGKTVSALGTARTARPVRADHGGPGGDRRDAPAVVAAGAGGRGPGARRRAGRPQRRRRRTLTVRDGVAGRARAATGGAGAAVLPGHDGRGGRGGARYPGRIGQEPDDQRSGESPGGPRRRRRGLG